MERISRYLRSRLTSVNPWTLAFLLLVVLYVIPIWIFKYFPSQDGPPHFSNAFILRHYNDPQYVFNQFYEIRKAPIPNWASHAIMMLLMYLAPPLIAEKLLLTGYIVLMAGGMLYLLNAVGKERTPLVFLGLPFIYNHPLLIGFYNFLLSVAMLTIAMGYWWKHFETFRAKNMFILALLLVITYFCHLVGLVLTLFSIGTVAILLLAFRFDRWKQTLLSLLSMLPAIGLTIYYLKMWGTERGESGRIGDLWNSFIRNEALAYYSQSQLTIAKFVTVAFVILFLYTLIRDHFFTKEWRRCLRVHRKDFFLLLCVAFFFIYLKAPEGIAGGWCIKMRLVFLPFLIIIPWLSWDMPKIAKGIIGGLLIILAATYLIHSAYYHKRLSDQVEIYTSGYDVVERNKVILPLSFGNKGGSWRIGVLFHTGGYYTCARGSIDLDNYEAGLTDYFPTLFKPEVHRPSIGMIVGRPGEINFAEYAGDIDYIITWNLASGNDIEARILEHYKLIKQNGSLKIFNRKIPGASVEPQLNAEKGDSNNEEE